MDFVSEILDALEDISSSPKIIQRGMSLTGTAMFGKDDFKEVIRRIDEILEDYSPDGEIIDGIIKSGSIFDRGEEHFTIKKGLVQEFYYYKDLRSVFIRVYLISDKKKEWIALYIDENKESAWWEDHERE